MPFELMHDYDYPFESAAAIERLMGGEHPCALREELRASTFDADAEKEIDECLDPIIGVYNVLEGALDLSDERIPFLFGGLTQVDGRLWTLFIAPPAGLRDPEDHLRGFFRLLALEGETPAHADANALSARIIGASLPLESKGRLLLAVAQFEALDAFLRPYLAHAEALLREALPRLDASRAATLNALAAKAPALLAASLGFPIHEPQDTACPVRPSFAAFDRIFLQNGCLYWGIGSLPLFALQRRRDLFSRDKLLEVLRVLADKTKYDILRMLCTETLFGGQLAERTGLSSATISHHISQLMALWLVRAVKDGTRVYYALDRDLLDAYLCHIRSSLLEG